MNCVDGNSGEGVGYRILPSRQVSNRAVELGDGREMTALAEGLCIGLSREGHRYLFTVVDRSTRWPEAIPIFNASSASCAAALLSGWISRFGIPVHITSDRGTSFTSQLWTSLGQLLDTSIHHTTAYNPEAKGIVERFHRTLMSRCSNSMWFSQLPFSAFERFKMKGSTSSQQRWFSATPSFFLANSSLMLHQVTTSPDYDASSGSSPPANRPTGHPNTVTSPEIYARRSMFSSTPTPTRLTSPYSGPYEVIERKEKALRGREGIPAADQRRQRLDLDRSPKTSVPAGRRPPSNAVLQGGPPLLTYHGASSLMGEYCNRLVASLFDPEAYPWFYRNVAWP
ncbi:uncharacterized protein LOC119596715 [Penaeus monodon]|uniref:uncharacterized protein LOC119596715 n=1 Tax=Penaeus monodon TaxID=6687 RepID=UPI0018A76BB3|nr:uncharacterized protein LOC119596715 [Penaeus monodon]